MLAVKLEKKECINKLIDISSEIGVGVEEVNSVSRLGLHCFMFCNYPYEEKRASCFVLFSFGCLVAVKVPRISSSRCRAACDYGIS